LNSLSIGALYFFHESVMYTADTFLKMNVQVSKYLFFFIEAELLGRRYETEALNLKGTLEVSVAIHK
jgi:hypothetical protein